MRAIFRRNRGSVLIGLATAAAVALLVFSIFGLINLPVISPAPKHHHAKRHHVQHHVRHPKSIVIKTRRQAVGTETPLPRRSHHHVSVVSPVVQHHVSQRHTPATHHHVVTHKSHKAPPHVTPKPQATKPQAPQPTSTTPPLVQVHIPPVTVTVPSPPCLVKGVTC